MRRVEGQLPGRLLPQVDQEGGVDHGHGEATPPLLLPYGNVGRRAFIITLQDGKWLNGLHLYSAFTQSASQYCPKEEPGIELATWRLPADPLYLLFLL